MTTSDSANPQTADRVIRVFISSTFRDMMRERDLLVKEVFPELRRKCAKRFVTFTEVDLRWGITEAQANEGQVLPLCLAEIERSRPYFIGLLGERYGWIPDTIRPEVIAREPWLQEHVQGRTSVTELEILHGVLNNPKMQRHAFFYFRDPVYVNDSALTDDERRDMVERDFRADVERYGPAEATRRTEARKAKLVALKQRIRDSKLPVAEPYPNPRTLARLIRRQFNRLIDHLYPEDQTPDPLAQERMAHEAHAKNKLFACIDRPVHLAALNAFAALAEHNGKGLVVTGESGGGKTALLAAWARDWAKNHPEDFLFQHYFGATPDSASPEGFLRRLLGELKNRFGITDDIPADPEKLRDALPLWLAQSIGKGRIVLVLDGLNQVQGSEPDRHLFFLPRHFPPHVTVLASSLDGPALEELHKRGWVKHDLPLADQAEVDAMVGEYLNIHARTLEPELRHQLVTSPGAKNPLFLRTVLEELRQFGSFERLPQRIRHYLEADNPKDLFLRVLTRWQEDFDGKDPEQDKPKLDLVRRALTHLWAARQGLSEPEWLDLLGDGSQPLPRTFWTPLFLALEPHLSQRDGLYAFGHDFLRQAVEEAFVPSGDMQKTARLSVADYFEYHVHQHEMTPRKAAEWPYQLHAAAVWDRLEACLTDIPLFLTFCNTKTIWELTGYWHPLRRLGRDMGARYQKAAAQLLDDSYSVVAVLGAFLLENGLYAAAQPLLERTLEIKQRLLGSEHPSTLESLSNLSVLLKEQGEYAEAERLCRQTLETRERVLGLLHPDTLFSVINLATLLGARGDDLKAEPYYQQAIESSNQICGADHPTTLATMENMAALLARRGRYKESESQYRAVLKLRESVLGLSHPDTVTTSANLAAVFLKKGDVETAEPLLREALETSDKLLGPEHPYALVAAGNLAMALAGKGDFVEAHQLVLRVLETRKRLLGEEHPETLTAIGNLGTLLMNKGDLEGAEPLLRRASQAHEQILGQLHPVTLGLLHNLGLLLERKKDYIGAGAILRQVLKSREQTLGALHPESLRTANALYILLKKSGDTSGAISVLQSLQKNLPQPAGAPAPKHLEGNPRCKTKSRQTFGQCLFLLVGALVFFGVLWFGLRLVERILFGNDNH